MNRSTSTYCQTNFNTTTAGAITSLVFTDEEKASGFFDSKSLRKQICRTLLASNTPIASSGFLDSKAQRKCLFSGFVFTGKERDEETGYGYFGARYMDHELMTMWLSVDPMADKYPSISPYAYCAWNPVKLVDPDGRDWYQNIYTGSIYFNSDLHGTEGAGKGGMEGAGWNHLGENDMFKENGNDVSHSGLTLAASNGGSINQVLDNPNDFSENKTHIRGELMLEGDKAENFMKSQGYKKMPLHAKVKVQIVTQNISEGDGSVYVQKDDRSYVSKVYSTTYVKNPPRNPRYSVKKATPWENDINIARSISSRTEIRQYDYSRGNNWDIIAAGLSIIASLMSGL